MNIGQRIKDVRKIKHFTLQDLSESTGLSIGFLSNMERDTTSPTLANLQKICTSLDINITDLLVEDNLTQFVVKKDQRKEIFNSSSHVKYESITDSIFDLKSICITIPQDCIHKEISWGHKSNELGIIAKGSLELEIGTELFIVEEGDSIYIPANTPHSYRKVSEEECISYWIFTPDSKGG